MTESGSHPEEVTFTGPQGVRMVSDCWRPDTSSATRGTVLLLHGGGQTRHSWARTSRWLAKRGWTAYTVDARGHGDSEWSPGGVYTLDTFVSDLHSVIDALEQPPVVIGASLGGRTALVAEGERPGTVAGLVLVDIAHRIDEAGQARVKTFMNSAPNGFTSLEEVAEAIDSYRPRTSKRRNLEGLRKNLRKRADGRWYWHWDPQFMRFSAEPRNFDPARLDQAARNVAAPTLLVRGTRSDMVTPEAAAELVEIIPDAHLAEVAAGHMIAGDDNDAFSNHLDEFLEKRVQQSAC